MKEESNDIKENSIVNYNGQEKNRIIYYDVLRILAIFFVVVLHVSSANWYKTDVNTYNWFMMNFYDSISRWCNPILVMISGSLFLNREIEVKVLYKKYIFRIATALIFWSFVYSFFYTVIGKKEGLTTFIVVFIKGYFHLWFLYMIIGLYMITPFLKKIIKDEKLTKYFIILASIFTLIIPEIISIIQEFSPEYAEALESAVDNSYMKFVCGFTVYYILGYFLSSRTLSKKQYHIIYILGIVGFLSTIILSLIISKKHNEAIATFYSSMTLNVALEAICIFTLGKNLISKKIAISNKTSEIIGKLSKYSFGAYLIHALIQIFLDKVLGIHSLLFNPLFSIPVVAIIIYIASFCISAILHQIPVVKKYLV